MSFLSSRQLFVSVAVLLTMLCENARAVSISFEFNVDGTLPSAEGATYMTGGSNYTPPGAPESDVFSTGGGVLSQDSTGWEQYGSVYSLNGVDYGRSITLEWRLKLSPNSFGNTAIELGTIAPSGGPNWGFFFYPDRLIFQDGLGSPLNSSEIVPLDLTQSHTFLLQIPAASTHFDLYIDNALSLSRSTPVVFSSATYADLLWGDVSTSDGATYVQWDFVRINNVPEPTTLSLLAVAIPILLALRKQA